MLLNQKLLVVISFNYVLYFLSVQANNFGIIEPFPENVYSIEGTSAQVTCIAFDSSGVTSPERIQFMRRDKFARYTNITATDISFEQKTVDVDHGR